MGESSLSDERWDAVGGPWPKDLPRRSGRRRRWAYSVLRCAMEHIVMRGTGSANDYWAARSWVMTDETGTYRDVMKWLDVDGEGFRELIRDAGL